MGSNVRAGSIPASSTERETFNGFSFFVAWSVVCGWRGQTAVAVKVLQIDTFRKQACLCLILQHRLRLLPSNVMGSATMLTDGRLRGYIDFIARP